MTSICAPLDSLKKRTSLIFVGVGPVVKEKMMEEKEVAVLVWWVVVGKLQQQRRGKN
jgi:hypothetical protein